MHNILIVALIVVIVLLQIKYFSKLQNKLSSFKKIFSSNELSKIYIDDDSLIAVKGMTSSWILTIDRKDAEEESLWIEQEITSRNEEIKNLNHEINIRAEAIANGNGNGNDYTSEIKNFEDSIIKLTRERDELNKKYHNLKGILKEYADSNIDNLSKENILYTIIFSINKYLYNNNDRVSDFSIMKDIVDRNCETAEEELHTLVPVPLYCGLVGTMGGILVGVTYLVLSGSLEALLKASNDTGADGITALLWGVGIAMICSIIGVVLTTISSLQLKDVKIDEEIGKHNFLTLLQSKLLPELSNDMADSFRRLTENLNSFNDTFSKNTKELKSTLQTVNETSKGQANIIDASNKIITSINNLNIKQLASANISVYEKLKGCSEEIGNFAEYLSSTNDYLREVRTLTTKLGEADERTKMIEEMACFFKDERANMEIMRGIISKETTRSDDAFSEAIDTFKENFSKYMSDLTKTTTNLTQNYEDVVDEQNKALVNKTKEIDNLVKELKQLSDVKESIEKMSNATSEQNKKIDKLAESIKELANAKSTGGPIKPFLPAWIKWGTITLGSLAIISCLYYLITNILTFL